MFSHNLDFIVSSHALALVLSPARTMALDVYDSDLNINMLLFPFVFRELILFNQSFI